MHWGVSRSLPVFKLLTGNKKKPVSKSALVISAMAFVPLTHATTLIFNYLWLWEAAILSAWCICLYWTCRIIYRDVA